jgi:hypothetical protein
MNIHKINSALGGLLNQLQDEENEAFVAESTEIDNDDDLAEVDDNTDD